MKTIWQGSLSFGLVTISVDLYPAIKQRRIEFKLLHDKCKTPIENERWCPKCKEKVSWQHIIKGTKNQRRGYFIITQENLQNLKSEKNYSIEIVQFIEEKLLSLIYYDQHYYLLPQRNKKPYLLFAKIIKDLSPQEIKIAKQPNLTPIKHTKEKKITPKNESLHNLLKKVFCCTRKITKIIQEESDDQPNL